jgi:hypothetical protein
VNDEVVVRAYRAGDEVSINEGFCEVFGVQRSLEDWRWKFGDQAERARIHVAERGGEIVAHFAALPARCRWSGREWVLGQTVDVFARRRPGLVQGRLFERLVREAYAAWAAGGLDGVFGFPGERHLRLGLARLDYCAPQPVVVWTRPPRQPALGAGALAQPWPATAELDRLWERASRRLAATFARDGATLALRFSGRPGVDYQLLVVRRWWGRLEAIAVVRADRGRLEVADLVWDGRRSAALLEIDRQLEALVATAGGSAELWLGGDPAAAAVLRELGWIEAHHPAGLGATAKSFRADLDARALVETLFVTMLDADLV